jgi:hypothetical protein
MAVYRLLGALGGLLLLLAAGAAAKPAKRSPQGPNWTEVYNKLTGRTGRDPNPEFCVIVRTYWGHGQTAGDGGLRRLLRSLQLQSVQSWEAVLLVLDARPFEDLHHIVQDFHDDRIWVFAEWIDKAFKPKVGVEWAPGYHGTLYNLTDDAIQVCPPSTRWLVVTNGDNEYADNFMQLVKDGGKGADLVAVDFYSRYQRPTAPSCERFAAIEGAPPCKTNRLRWCHTDLGANAISYQRFQKEGRRFGTLGVRFANRVASWYRQLVGCHSSSLQAAAAACNVVAHPGCPVILAGHSLMPSAVPAHFRRLCRVVWRRSTLTAS